MEIFIGLLMLGVIVVFRKARQSFPDSVWYAKQLLHGDTHHWSYKQLEWALWEMHGRPKRLPEHIQVCLNALKDEILGSCPEIRVHHMNRNTCERERTSLTRFLQYLNGRLATDVSPEWFIELCTWECTTVLTSNGDLLSIREGFLGLVIWKGIPQGSKYSIISDVAKHSEYIGYYSPGRTSRTVDHSVLCWWLTVNAKDAFTLYSLRALLYEEARSRGFNVYPPAPDAYTGAYQYRLVEPVESGEKEYS